MEKEVRHIVETTGGKIADLAVSSETSSFALLNAIEQTVTTLSAVAQVYNAYARVLGEQLSSLADEPVVSGQYIDPEDVAISAIERVINTFNATRRTLQAQQASVFVDAELRPHHCESLSDAYAEALVALDDLIDIWRDIRATIITRDLAAEPRDGEGFASVEALLTDLHGQ